MAIDLPCRIFATNAKGAKEGSSRVQGRFWWLASVQFAQGCTWQQKSCTLQKVAFCTRLSFEKKLYLANNGCPFLFCAQWQYHNSTGALCTLFWRICVCGRVEEEDTMWRAAQSQSTWWIWGFRSPLPGTDSSKAEAEECYVPTLCPPNPPKARLLQIIVKLQLHSALLLCH